MDQDQKNIDGKKLAAERVESLRREIAKLPIQPKIVSIIVGDDAPSLLYTNIKEKKAQEIGIAFQSKFFSADAPFEEVATFIEQQSGDPSVNGILVQLPVPESSLQGRAINELLEKIVAEKDIDGLRKDSPFLPAAVVAVLSILKDEKITVAGKNIAVLGASDLVGKPVARELTKMGGLVYVCDINTPNLRAITLEADIIISATGTPGLVIGKMVKDGVVVIDVGSEKVGEKVLGDVDFNSVYPKVSKITPVPGGVGPMTVVSLLENVVKSVRGNV